MVVQKVPTGPVAAGFVVQDINYYGNSHKRALFLEWIAYDPRIELNRYSEVGTTMVEVTISIAVRATECLTG